MTMLSSQSVQQMPAKPSPDPENTGNTTSMTSYIDQTVAQLPLPNITVMQARILDEKLAVHPRLANASELAFCARLTGLSEAVVDEYLRIRLARGDYPAALEANGVPKESIAATLDAAMTTPTSSIADIVANHPVASSSTSSPDLSMASSVNDVSMGPASDPSVMENTHGGSAEDEGTEECRSTRTCPDSTTHTHGDESALTEDTSSERPRLRSATRRNRRPVASAKPHPTRSWVHDDLSKVVPRTFDGPVYWQRATCKRKMFSQFERCAVCVLKNSETCRFSHIRVFGIRPEAAYKSTLAISSEDLIYGPSFRSAVKDEVRREEEPIDKPVISMHSENGNDMLLLDQTAKSYHIGGPEAFILACIAPAVQKIVERELAFMQSETTYRREWIDYHRQICDACMTNILSGYWMCCVCGAEICMDCYDEWENSKDYERIIRCTYSRSHSKQHMVRLARFSVTELNWLRETLGRWLEKHHQLTAISVPLPLPSANMSSMLQSSEPSAMPPNVIHVTLENGQLGVFQQYWSRGEACVVPDMMSKFDRELWTPQWFIQYHGHEVTEMIDCRTGAALDGLTVGDFFKGFSDMSVRPCDHKGQRMILKLKDWPSNDDFRDKFPMHFHDFMDALPFKPYTHREGTFNLACRLPENYVPPDLGPKMYNAYGSSDGEGGAGTTNLHLDMADAVNVLVYASYVDNLPETGADGAPCSDYTVRPAHVPAAAVWDIYRLEDLPKIRQFLMTVANERGIRVDDPVHDQIFYLDQTLRDRLYRTYGVQGWRIFQNPGDAVFVPAGCAHQVCNYASCIKVAMDYVSPENVSRCAQLTGEFRLLSQGHRRKQDILQLNSILYHAWLDCEAKIMGRRVRFISETVSELANRTPTTYRQSNASTNTDEPTSKRRRATRNTPTRTSTDRIQRLPSAAPMNTRSLSSEATNLTQNPTSWSPPMPKPVAHLSTPAAPTTLRTNGGSGPNHKPTQTIAMDVVNETHISTAQVDPAHVDRKEALRDLSHSNSGAAYSSQPKTPNAQYGHGMSVDKRQTTARSVKQNYAEQSDDEEDNDYSADVDDPSDDDYIEPTTYGTFYGSNSYLNTPVRKSTRKRVRSTDHILSPETDSI